MDWTIEEHQQALQRHKEATDRWSIEALRQWSNEYTRSQIRRMEEYTSTQDELEDLAAEFMKSFYEPVFLPEYNRMAVIKL